MSELLNKVKANLILAHAADDTLLEGYITAAVSYAESYQHLDAGFYSANTMPPTTEQAVIMLMTALPRWSRNSRAVRFLWVWMTSDLLSRRL